MWGQVSEVGIAPSRLRIIPTRVGTSVRVFLRTRTKQDHPHACGDKFLYVFQASSKPGSSPRVWGQADKNEALTMQNGIIPTRMGTRATYKVIAVCYWDHPHAYGDKYETSLQSRSIDGSSPRVWGQVVFHLRSKPVHRIIPTRMGTSPSPCRYKGLSKDHPHAYGDKLFFTCVLNQSIGSSPRVWGQVQALVGTRA